MKTLVILSLIFAVVYIAASIWRFGMQDSLAVYYDKWISRLAGRKWMADAMLLVISVLLVPALAIKAGTPWYIPLLAVSAAMAPIAFWKASRPKWKVFLQCGIALAVYLTLLI